MTTLDGYEEIGGRNESYGTGRGAYKTHSNGSNGQEPGDRFRYLLENRERESEGNKGKGQMEASDQRIRNAERMHDEELSRTRGMQEYWKRLSERVAHVGRKINRRINEALDNPIGAEGTEPDTSGSRPNDMESDRMRGQENDPKPYRRIE